MTMKFRLKAIDETLRLSILFYVQLRESKNNDIFKKKVKGKMLELIVQVLESTFQSSVFCACISVVSTLRGRL